MDLDYYNKATRVVVGPVNWSESFCKQRNLKKYISGVKQAIPAYINLPNKVYNIKYGDVLHIEAIYRRRLDDVVVEKEIPIETVSSAFLSYSNFEATMQKWANIPIQAFIAELMVLSGIIAAVPADLSTVVPFEFYLDGHDRLSMRTPSTCGPAYFDAVWKNNFDNYVSEWVINIKTLNSAFETLFFNEASSVLFFGTDDPDDIYLLWDNSENLFALGNTLGQLEKFKIHTSIPMNKIFDPYYNLREIYVLSNFTNNVGVIEWNPPEQEPSFGSNAIWGIIPFDVDENSKNQSVNFQSSQLLNSFNTQVFENMQLSEIALTLLKRNDDGTYSPYPFISNEITIIVDFQ